MLGLYENSMCLRDPEFAESASPEQDVLESLFEKMGFTSGPQASPSRGARTT
jgi:hypothetical protein